MQTARILVVVAAATVFVQPTVAQHFSKPGAIDPDTVRQIGEPLFTIARPSTSFGSAVEGGWLYVLGGYTGRPHDYYHEAQSSDFFRINLLDPTHQEMLPNQQGVQSCPLEAWKGGIIRTGGMVALNSRGEDARLDSLDTVAWFDSSSREWKDLPALPAGRSSHDTAIIGSTLYAVGGWSMDAESGVRTWLNTVGVLDLSSESPEWTELPQPFQRRALASVNLDDKLVVVGGLQQTAGISNDVDIYDPASGAWSKGPAFPGSAFGVAGDVTDGRVVVSGSDGSVYSWSFGEAEWTYEATLTFPRFFHQVAADLSGDLLFVGGISRGVRPVHVERVVVRDGHAPAVKMHHWIVPSPMASKNRQGMFVHDGRLALFGGNNSTGQHDFEPENFLSDGHMLSLAGLSWRKMPAYPVPRQTIQTVITPDEKGVLAAGGFAHDGDVARGFGDAFMYDFKSREWSAMGTVLPAPRSQFGLVEHNGSYWIFGGLDYDPRRAQGDHFRHLAPVLSAEATGDSLVFEQTGIDLPRTRRAFGGATLNGSYYLVGGMTDNFTIVEETDVFDFETRTFSMVPSPSRPRLSPSLVELGGKLYIAGGSSPKSESRGFEPNPSIEVFDPETQAWTTLIDAIPVTPRHLRMTTFRGRLMLVSTHTDDADLVHIILIDPAVEQERTVTQVIGSSR